MSSGLEETYRRHHSRSRKTDWAILADERGAWLKKWVGNKKEVLDIGCRDGELTKHYIADNQVLGLDIDKVALERAQEKTGMKIRQVDLNGDWDIANESFDRVVACEVIEHLYHPKVVLEKIAAALKPGGLLIGTIPHAFSLQVRIKFLFGRKDSTPLSDPTHINQFAFKEFKQLLEATFEDIELETVITKRYSWLRPLFPSLFAHTIMFKAKKKEGETHIAHETKAEEKAT